MGGRGRRSSSGTSPVLPLAPPTDGTLSSPLGASPRVLTAASAVGSVRPSSCRTTSTAPSSPTLSLPRSAARSSTAPTPSTSRFTTPMPSSSTLKTSKLFDSAPHTPHTTPLARSVHTAPTLHPHCPHTAHSAPTLL